LIYSLKCHTQTDAVRKHFLLQTKTRLYSMAIGAVSHDKEATKNYMYQYLMLCHVNHLAH